MEINRLWAGVTFMAVGGRTEVLLQSAAEQGLRLRHVKPLSGGFSADCPARQYLRLLPLARRCRVRLRVLRRHGVYFALRATLRRRGLFAGALVFGLLLWQAQGLVWAVDCSGLTAGQAARAMQALREVGLQPGARVTQQLLTAGEYALLENDGEFSWASVNFEKGRLTVEAAAAKPVPEIDGGEIRELVAKSDGQVVAVKLEDGTPMVTPGQQVAAGQVLIGTARADRAGALNYRRAAGVVLAQVNWQGEAQQALSPAADMLTGEYSTWYELSAAGGSFILGRAEADADALVRRRHTQLSLLGLPLPVAVTEYTAFYRQTQAQPYSESLALSLARLACQRQLEQQFPGAEILTWQETVSQQDGVLTCKVSAAILADLCTEAL